MKSPIMSKSPAKWDFTISHTRRPDGIRAYSSIFIVDSAEHIHMLAKRSGLKYTERKTDQLAIKRDGALPIITNLKVSELEGSKALKEILSGINELYGINLEESSIIPNQGKYSFNIRKVRTFSKSEINHYEYLMVYTTQKIIGSLETSREEDYKNGLFYLENSNYLKNKTSFGTIVYQGSFGVSTELKEKLETYNLNGLRFISTKIHTKSTSQKKTVWILSSEIVLPRSSTPLLNHNGYVKEPFDKWDQKWEEARFYDHGYQPPCLTYDTVPDFDIAITAEKQGCTYREFPHIIISQKFKKILDSLKIKNEYCPINIKNKV